jgi:calcineurin-like phosphoesterase family protein
VADTHFGHKLMVRLRGFNTAEEMDEELIKRWNATVEPNQHIFVLGDISWYNPNKTDEILQRLNGIKYLVNGNHDWQCEKQICKRHFKLIADRIELEVFDEDTLMETHNDKKLQMVVLDHYPMLSWNKAYHNSLHLFGHVHGKNAGVGKSMDVGVDVSNLAPVSYAYIKDALKIKANHEKQSLE